MDQLSPAARCCVRAVSAHFSGPEKEEGKRGDFRLLTVVFFSGFVFIFFICWLLVDDRNHRPPCKCVTVSI